MSGNGDYLKARKRVELMENFLEVFKRQGYVLMWSDVLQERIVYHADGLDRDDLPRGVVLYSESELKVIMRSNFLLA